jgi:hypothetical protein
MGECGSYVVLRAELFAHRSAELGDDGSAEFHGDAADGEQQDWGTGHLTELAI